MSEPVQSQDRPRRGRTGVIVGSVLGGLLLLVAAAYVAGYFMASNKTPRNASVEGVSIGGLTHGEAVNVLNEQLGPRYDKPITLEGDGNSAQLKPSEAGMVVDFDRTVAKAGAGRSWDPVKIWNVLRGGGAIGAVTRIDQSALDRAVASTASTFATEGKDATIAIEGIKAVTTPHTPSVTLNQSATAKAVRKAWPTSDKVQVAVDTADPEITTDEVDKVKKEYADPALSGPIVVKAGPKTFNLDVKTIAAATTFTAKDGNVTAATDMEKVWKEAEKDMDSLGFAKGKDARFTFKAGKPFIDPSVDGVGVDKKSFIDTVGPAITKTGQDRTVSVKVTKQPPTFSTGDAEKLGVKEVIGEFTTQFPYAEYRNINLSRVASVINGKLVKPGEVFSMNDTLGERTKANGYVDGYVIQGSRLKKETGGGVSQSATTLFNAIFFAGLEDVEHHPHTLYFPRYPAGREATLYYGKLDLKFRNNTNYGVVIQAYVQKAAPGGQGSMTIKIWSTKTWDAVKSTELVKTDYYDAPDQTNDEPDCEPQAKSPGFTVNWKREFYKGGKVVKSEPYRWTYAATPQITCTKS
ncbi:VanW family protein [Aestuariimicrobium sp. p3-SID1156]|uniref:VanW family protein n=1 Tax=Aestuariimicrobium sp. p3-SID1156 TaxID=2916038 RepID=UPI00223ABF74|nr:VanW family protein [Aestuariimicrobium sp. p3-SID1156]MCT1459581.1 VanW family protein [Aestuariimicrobium sp. p3-SID1156]